MKIWKHSPRDLCLLALSGIQLGAMLGLAATWAQATWLQRLGGFALLVFMMTYNIVVISHLFTHTNWFEPRWLNALASMLNSLNIGQSVQRYQLLHVRNHHRYNNDRKGPDGKAGDLSSTFQDGRDGDHDGVWHYAFVGAVDTLLHNTGPALLSVTRLWLVGGHEQTLRDLATKDPVRRAQELRQIQLDRLAYFVGVAAFLAISWQWTLLCYLPAFFAALALVNVQNYYEHFGAAPESRFTDSVSHYGRVYNLLTFNDGFHQEHHLRPQAHWTQMPRVRQEQGAKLDAAERIVSPVPAIVGFLDRKRRRLDRLPPVASPTPEP